MPTEPSPPSTTADAATRTPIDRSDDRSRPERFVLRLSCPDKMGIVHAVAGGLVQINGNIIENAQFGEASTGQFCMRTVFESHAPEAQIIAAMQPILTSLEAEYSIRSQSRRHRVLILVSKFDHCLVDLLYRCENGEIPVDVVGVVSNHPNCEPIARRHGISYEHLPVTPSTKAQQESSLRTMIDDADVDLVVLARYMQVLTDGMCEFLRGRAINIHHSFLPGFKGAKPYHQAYDRGVKLIGATAHFVTADLDEGPIIEQGVARVDHSHSATDMVTIGRDIERTVLSKAVRYWAEDRILLVGDRTVVFS